LKQFVITDTVPLAERVAPLAPRIKILSVAALLGEAMKRIHLNQSVSSLFVRGGNAGKR